MKNPFLYGLGIAVAGFVLILVLHILGYLTDPERFGTGSLILSGAGLFIIPIAGLVLGMKKVRAEKGPAGLSYGQAYATGVMVGVFAALLAVGFNFIYFKFINPEYTETSIVWTRSFMERRNLGDAVIDKVEADMRARSLTRQMVTGLIGGVVWNAVLSLILAAFIKRAPVDPLGAPPIARI